MQKRTAEILEAVDSLIAAHDAWENDPDSPRVPTQFLDDAVSELDDVVMKGDVPAPCMAIRDACGKLVQAWRQYRDGDWNRDGTPRGAVWNAYRDILAQRHVVLPPEPRQIESVMKLREEKVSDLQIARVYGVRDERGHWNGPFFNELGQILHNKIDQQHDAERGLNGAKPVIPDGWQHPEQQRLAEQRNAAMRKRIELADHKATAEQPHEEQASIAEMLREGAFIGQICRVKHCTPEEVQAVAESEGLEAREAGDEEPAKAGRRKGKRQAAEA